jgi:hypothetical protein
VLPLLKQSFDDFKHVVDKKPLPYSKAVLLDCLCVEGLKGLEQATKIDKHEGSSGLMATVAGP